MADDQEQILPEVGVKGRNRFQDAATRVSRATDVFSAGTFAPKIRALLQPGLYRERGDTNALLEDALADDGPLARISASNPELVTELRQQAANPMNERQHQQFRSSILQMVQGEVDRETKVRSTLQDNQSFLESFHALDSSIPGIKDPDKFTFEEAERKQILGLYQQAQQMAVLDPEGSKAIMADVRKKADALTVNVRTFMERNRKLAMADDTALSTSAREQINETNDILESLQHDSDERGFLKSPNEALIARAMAALGRAQNLPQPGFGEAGAASGANVANQVGGAKGTLIGEGMALAGKLIDKVKQSGDVKDLMERLRFNAGLIERGYQQNRQALQKRYEPLGIRFGEQPGDVSAVLEENYRAEGDKIPAKTSTPEQSKKEQADTLRQMLQDEHAAASAAVEKLSPEASANMPGASQRLAAATARAQNAADDLAVFEDDQRAAAGGPEPQTEDAAKAISQARARRKGREEMNSRGQVRTAIQESLRSRLR